jgi:hypothetical protein
LIRILPQRAHILHTFFPLHPFLSSCTDTPHPSPFACIIGALHNPQHGHFRRECIREEWIFSTE